MRLVGPSAVLVYRDRMPMTACAQVDATHWLLWKISTVVGSSHFHQLMHQFVVPKKPFDESDDLH
jgi:hypothetical protein